jgi:histidinol-phosphate aminotransferase
MKSIINLARDTIQTLSPYRSARQESKQQGIHLDANENPFWREDGMNRYPDPQPPKLRQKLAERYGVESSQLLMTRGSDEGIDLLVRVFCEPRRDAVLITEPIYGMYEVAAGIQGVAIIKIPLNAKEGFCFDKDTVLNQWNPTIKLIFLCSPNNPTGNVLKVEDLLSLCEALKNQALIVLDEAYIEFSTTTSLSTYVSQYSNLVVLRTLSKAAGLAGARLGSLIAERPVIALLEKVIAPYPIPRPVERLALEAFSSENQARVASEIQSIQRIRDDLERFLEGCEAVEQVYPSQANFLLVKVKDAPQWMALCQKQGIILRLRPPNYVRITIGTHEEIEYLKEVLSNG